MVNLPPGLRGYVAAGQLRDQKQAQELAMLGQLVSLQNAAADQQMRPLQMEKAKLEMQGLRDKQAQQQKLLGLLGNDPRLQNDPVLAAAVHANPASALQYLMPKPKGDQIIPAGATVRDDKGNIVFTAPFKPEKVAESDLTKLIRERDALPPGDPNRRLFDDKITKLTSHAPAARQTTIVNPMRETFKDEQALRKEYTDQSKDYIQLSEGYGKVKGALASDPTRSAPATLAAATQFMKMLDPSSVVRESELGMALAAAGMWDRFQNLYNTVQHGKVLTPQQASEFGRIADVVFGAANAAHQKRVQHYRGLSQSYNFNPDRVVPDYTPKAAAPAARALDALPKATPTNKGMKIRDTQTGEILQSDGLSWKPVKK